MSPKPERRKLNRSAVTDCRRYRQPLTINAIVEDKVEANTNTNSNADDIVNVNADFVEVNIDDIVDVTSDVRFMANVTIDVAI